ncbi:matrix metallopeptidase 23B, partial [Homo sapiens]
MGRGARVPSEAPGAGVERRWLGAALVALCLLPALVLLARLGAPAVPAWSAAQSIFRGSFWSWGPSPMPPTHAFFPEGRRRCAGPLGGPPHPGPGPTGPPQTPLHADSSQAALGPLQPHLQDPLLPAEPAEPAGDAAGPSCRLPHVERRVPLQLPRGGPRAAQRPPD